MIHHSPEDVSQSGDETPHTLGSLTQKITSSESNNDYIRHYVFLMAFAPLFVQNYVFSYK